MDSSVSPKDEIWFLPVCHHISNAVYLLDTKLDWSGQTDVIKFGFKIQRLHKHLKNIFLQLDTAKPLDHTSGINNTSQYCKDMYSRNVETVTQTRWLPFQQHPPHNIATCSIVCDIKVKVNLIGQSTYKTLANLEIHANFVGT
jgi:hypothetical protein